MIKHISFLFLAACGIENGFEDVEPVSYDYELPTIPGVIDSVTTPVVDETEATVPTEVEEVVDCEFVVESLYNGPLTVENYPTFTLIGSSEINVRVGDTIRLQIEVTSVPDCGPLDINVMSFWVTPGPAEFISYDNLSFIGSELELGLAELNGSPGVEASEESGFIAVMTDIQDGDTWVHDNPWIQRFDWTDETVIPAKDNNNYMPAQRLEAGDTLLLEFEWTPGSDNAPVGTTLTLLPMQLDWTANGNNWIYADTSEIFSDLPLTVHIVD